jgi:hypothetical protein
MIAKLTTAEIAEQLRASAYRAVHPDVGWNNEDLTLLGQVVDAQEEDGALKVTISHPDPDLFTSNLVEPTLVTTMQPGIRAGEAGVYIYRIVLQVTSVRGNTHHIATGTKVYAQGSFDRQTNYGSDGPAVIRPLKKR